MFQDETIAMRILEGEALRLVAYDETGEEIKKLKGEIFPFKWTNNYASPHPTKKHDFIKLHIDKLTPDKWESLTEQLEKLAAIIASSPLRFEIEAPLKKTS
jgi:hypothetical protein